MEILINADLTKFNNLRLKSVAKKMYIPESIDDLILITLDLRCKDYIVLSKGSNVVLRKHYKNVILLTKMNNTLKHFGNGNFAVGASVSLGKLVDYINVLGYGGIENLFNVPGLVGASTAMNAGSGKDRGIYIGNFVTKVKYIKDGVIYEKGHEECCFEYRNSVFKDTDSIIVEVELKFPEKSIEEIQGEKRDKTDIIKKYQDYKLPNVGSFFYTYNHRILSILRRIFNVIFKNGITFSDINVNWIQNKGKGTYLQVKIIYITAMITHKILLRKCKVEARFK